jgi:hypothetical protein
MAKALKDRGPGNFKFKTLFFIHKEARALAVKILLIARG